MVFEHFLLNFLRGSHLPHSIFLDTGECFSVDQLFFFL